MLSQWIDFIVCTILQIAYLGVSLLGSWLILRWALDKIDPNKNAKAAVST